jgi:hypothetical protein
MLYVYKVYQMSKYSMIKQSLECILNPTIFDLMTHVICLKDEGSLAETKTLNIKNINYNIN